jgi:protein-tyrosine phosphatase
LLQMTDTDKVALLFVCMGNICRSPTAEGVMRQVVADAAVALDITIDSAGTHAYHVDEPPDPRAVEAALRRGIDISGQRARAVQINDYHSFDFILAMDEDNLQLLERMAPANGRAKVELLLDYSPSAAGTGVPDPYYGGAAGFERVLDLLEDAASGLLEFLQSR